MLKRFSVSILLMCLLVIPIAAQDDSFESAPCPVPMPFSFVEDTGAGGIECGFVTVPEDYNDPDGTQIRLGVAIINSSSPSPQPDPLFMEQGGPGGSSIEIFVPSAPLFAGILAQRDIVIVEQRGTKFSEPFLDCPEVLDAIFMAFETVTPIDQAGAMQACFERLSGEGVNLSAYNSVNNAADMIAVADAFGYDEINFYGVSYGTMLGQHLLRDHEDRVRSMIFDAVVPLEQNFVPDVGINAQTSLEAVFAACAEDDFRSERYPDLQMVLADTYTALNDAPPIVPVIDSETGEVYDLPLTGNEFLGLVRLLQYNTPLIQNIPAYIDATANGDYEWVENLYGAVAISLQRDIADAMYFGVICSEDGDFLPEEMQSDGLAQQFADSSGIASSEVLEVCAAAGVEELGAFVDEPVISDVPSLLMSGELDPITPARYGDILAGNLSNSTHVVFGGYGHGALFGGTCPTSIIGAFLNDPSSDLNTACSEGLDVAFVEYATDPTGSLQFPVPTGLTDTSTDDFAQYQTDAGDMIVSLIAIENDDREAAINEALSAVVRDGFATPPLQSITETSALGDYVTNIYQDGTDLVIAFSVQREDTTAIMIMQFGTTQLQAAQNILQQVGISMLVAD